MSVMVCGDHDYFNEGFMVVMVVVSVVVMANLVMLMIVLKGCTHCTLPLQCELYDAFHDTSILSIGSQGYSYFILEFLVVG